MARRRFCLGRPQSRCKSLHTRAGCAVARSPRRGAVLRRTSSISVACGAIIQRISQSLIAVHRNLVELEIGFLTFFFCFVLLWLTNHLFVSLSLFYVGHCWTFCQIRLTNSFWTKAHCRWCTCLTTGAYKVQLRGYGNVADAISRGLCPTFLEPFLGQVGLRIRLLLYKAKNELVDVDFAHWQIGARFEKPRSHVSNFTNRFLLFPLHFFFTFILLILETLSFLLQHFGCRPRTSHMRLLLLLA